MKTTAEIGSLLFESMPCILVLLDRDGRIVDMNRRGLDFFRKQKSDLAGQYCYLALKQLSDPCSDCIIFNNSKIDFLSKKCFSLNGLDLTSQITPVKNEKNEIVGYLEIFDCCCSSGANIKKESDDSELKYRTIIETAGDAIIICDAVSGIIEDVNIKAEELTGRKRSEIVGMHQSELHPPEIRNNSIENYKRILLHFGETKITESLILNKEGDKIPVEIKLSLIQLSNGKKLIIGIFRNLTERMKKDVMLREAEERYRALFNNIRSGVAIYKTNDDGNDFIFKDFNTYAEKIENINKESLLGQKVTEVFAGVQEMGLLEVFRRVWKTGQPEFNEEAIYKTENIESWRENYVYKLPNNEIVAVYNDITHRKLSEFEVHKINKELEVRNEDLNQKNKQIERMNRKLVEGQNYLKSIFRAAPIGIGVVINRIMTFANEELCKMIGYQQEELLGNSARMLYPSDEEFEYVGKEKYKQIDEKGIGTVETKWQTKEGKILDILLSSSPIDSDNVLFGVTFSALDISERKKTEENLLQERDYNARISETSPVGIVSIDKNGKIIYANPMATKILGIEKDEITEKQYNAAQLKITDYDGNAYPQEELPFEKVKQRRQTIYNIRHAIERPDGTRVLLSINASPLFSEKNKFEGIVATIDDITERINSEKKIQDQQQLIVQQNEEYQAINEELSESYNKIQKINEELMASKEKAEENDRLKSAFLANMSHELRTPMNGILGFTDLLCRTGLDDEKRSDFAKIVRFSCDNLLHIVNDILDISKIEACQLKIIESEFSIEAMMENLFLIFKQKLEYMNKSDLVISLKKPAVSHEIKMISDEMRVRQVLNNLLDNAIKFTNDGTIEFGYDILNKNEMLFYVKDTGIGIPDDKFDIIFERFTQIDMSLSREFGGNGLGLAICKGLIDLLGGRIWTESKVDAGSIFYFTIPYFITDIHESKITEIKPELYQWLGKRVLIIEDDRISNDLLKEILTVTGLQSDSALNAKEALSHIGQNKYDLIFLDIRLPDINGLELAGQIRTISPEVLIIAQTAFAMEDDKLKCLKAGCDDYISKPIDIDVLYNKINNLF